MQNQCFFSQVNRHICLTVAFYIDLDICLVICYNLADQLIYNFLPSSILQDIMKHYDCNRTKHGDRSPVHVFRIWATNVNKPLLIEIKIYYVQCVLFFSKKGFRVRSFGSGTHVKLPGPAPDKPNIYDFNTTYDEMHRDLVMKDKSLYPLLWTNI